ncbi:MAG: hypothetical protein M3Y24_12710, partial [Acidobacteriota bacterium]|nr:hypothetical protein [Acidobacteriota bacterium]
MADQEKAMEINRRTFTRTMAAGAALAPFARSLQVQGQTEQQRLRYCIVGLGRISMDHFMPACKTSQ